MGVFFIDTERGTVATVHQLIAVGVVQGSDVPPRPWLRIQGTSDATTMWYAVMRRRERGIFLGTLVMRHTPHHALLRQQGWPDVGVVGREMSVRSCRPEGGSGAPISRECVIRRAPGPCV